MTASLAFGKFAVGQSATKTVTISNTGATHSASVSSVTSSDPEYTLSGAGSCGAIPITIAPKGSCTLGIGFAPNGVGAHGATLSLYDNATTSPQHVTLSGTGIAGLTTSKTSLTYGSVRFGLTSAASFSVTNHQTQSINLGESFGGANASDFSITGGTCGTTLAAAKACTITVTFKPGVLGTESATLSVVASPDPLSPYNIALSAAATIPDTVTPPTLSYGTVSRTSSKTLKATVTNHSAYPLSIDSAISGANAPDFNVTANTCGASINGNSSCTISVTFKPTTTSSEGATLGVTISSDPTSPHSVALTGTGS